MKKLLSILLVLSLFFGSTVPVVNANVNPADIIEGITTGIESITKVVNLFKSLESTVRTLIFKIKKIGSFSDFVLGFADDKEFEKIINSFSKNDLLEILISVKRIISLFPESSRDKKAEADINKIINDIQNYDEAKVIAKIREVRSYMALALFKAYFAVEGFKLMDWHEKNLYKGESPLIYKSQMADTIYNKALNEIFMNVIDPEIDFAKVKGRYIAALHKVKNSKVREDIMKLPEALEEAANFYTIHFLDRILHKARFYRHNEGKGKELALLQEIEKLAKTFTLKRLNPASGITKGDVKEAVQVLNQKMEDIKNQKVNPDNTIASTKTRIEFDKVLHQGRMKLWRLKLPYRAKRTLSKMVHEYTMMRLRRDTTIKMINDAIEEINTKILVPANAR